jgi:hypothetical protein
MRNKQTYSTYAFNIDIVPLVLEESCFAGHIFEFKWKTRQKTKLRKRKVDLAQRNQEKVHSTEETRPSIIEEGAQAQPPAHLAKAVARRAN